MINTDQGWSGFITVSVDNANDPKCQLATWEWLQGAGDGSGEMISGKWKQLWRGWRVERGGDVLCEENIMQRSPDITIHAPSSVLVDLW